MTIQQILKKYFKIEVDLLLAHVLNKPKEFLYANTKMALSKAQTAKLNKLIAKHKAGLPVAYIRGFKDFYGLKFKVSKDVLIPRPETEWIVDRALTIINKSRKKNFSVADVGTGSGCIGICIAKFSYADVTAVDISSRALKIAKQNAQANQANVKFLQRDLLKNLTQKFDLIIANLPYVPAKDYKKLYQNLKFEPKLALVDADGDLFLYKKLLDQIPARLNKNGWVLLEIDPSGKSELEKIIKKISSKNYKFYKDIKGLWRFCEINF